MPRYESRITILFEAPFWVAYYERAAPGRLEVCRITFGAEPRDGEVYDLLLQGWANLQFSPAIRTNAKPAAHANPKRVQRAIRRQLAAQQPIGTKAQQAVQAQREEHKLERKARRRENRLAEKERRFALKQQKRKAKHRGR